MNTDIDFFPNLVGSTPIPAFPPSPRLPPLPSISPTSLSPFSLPFPHSLILSSLIPFRHPKSSYSGSGEALLAVPAESGRSPGRQRAARISG